MSPFAAGFFFGLAVGFFALCVLAFCDRNPPCC